MVQISHAQNLILSLILPEIYILPTRMFVFLTYTSSILLRLIPQLLFQTCPMFLKRKLCKMANVPTCALFFTNLKILQPSFRGMNIHHI
jgi:hypothetical protein